MSKKVIKSEDGDKSSRIPETETFYVLSDELKHGDRVVLKNNTGKGGREVIGTIVSVTPHVHKVTEELKVNLIKYEVYDHGGVPGTLTGSFVRLSNDAVVLHKTPEDVRRETWEPRINWVKSFFRR